MRAEIVECDGKWFAHRGMHVLWSDDLYELVELLGDTNPMLEGDKYEVLRHDLTGLEMLVPSITHDWTSRQLELLLGMIEAAMKKAFLQ